MKRLADLIFALSGTVMLAPLFGFVVLAIFLTDGGPVIFKQIRVGREGRLFFIRKFRTMAVHKGAETGTFEPGNLGRITSFGRLLRKAKVDELPQLWNVILGDMSFVGPRPEVPEWVDACPERWERILTIRPGITDPASIAFRDEEIILARSPNPVMTYREIILPQKLARYEEYLRQRTLIGDIRIFAETFVSIAVDVLGRRC